MTGDSVFKINYDLLPIKAHYFLLNGALAGVLQFLPVYAKSLGISAIAVGIIYTVLPFISLVAKPFFGGIADRLQKLKIMIAIFVVIIGIFYLSLLLIPAIESPKSSIHSKTQCINHEISVALPPFNSSCLYDILSNKTRCNIICNYCSYGGNGNSSSVNLNVTYCEKHEYFYDILLESSSMSDSLMSRYNISSWTFSVTEVISSSCKPQFQSNVIDQDPSSNIYESIEQNNTNCKKPLYNLYYHSKLKDNISIWNIEINKANGTEKAACLSRNSKCSIFCEPDVQDCFQSIVATDSKNIYSSFQFWLLFIFIVFAWVSTGVATSLTDAACFEILKGEMHLYGKQRLWGTIGWGAIAALSGYCNSVATQNSSKEVYSPGFFILAILLIVDLVAISRMKIRTRERSKNIAKEVGSLYLKPHIVLFTFSVFAVGVFIGLMWSYLYWYIGELNGNQTLMGLTSAVQCFLGELPFFFFSGWIIKKIGHFNTLGVSLLASGVRYIAYAYLYNPWMVLVIEILQGPAFGAFYPAMTSYAKVAAPRGAEATMQGVLGGAFEGLGTAVGSLYGGVGFDLFGGRRTFLYAGIIAFSYGTLHFILYFILLRMEKKRDRKPEVVDPSEQTPLS